MVVALLAFIGAAYAGSKALEDKPRDGERVSLIDLLAKTPPNTNVTVTGFQIAPDYLSTDDYKTYVILLPPDYKPGPDARLVVVYFKTRLQPDEIAELEAKQEIRGTFEGKKFVNPGTEEVLRAKHGTGDTRQFAFVSAAHPRLLPLVLWCGVTALVALVARLVLWRWVPFRAD
jgi:hypothetical protein